MSTPLGIVTRDIFVLKKRLDEKNGALHEASTFRNDIGLE